VTIDNQPDIRNRDENIRMDDVRLGELSLGEIDTVQLLTPAGERMSDVR
jgi:hypothetical protein